MVALATINATCSSSLLTEPKNSVQKNEVCTRMVDENTIFTQWHNNFVPVGSDSISTQTFERYGVSADEAERSLDVFIQEEIVPFEEVVPASEAMDGAALSQNVDFEQREEYVHKKGYIKFTTIAYAMGFIDDHIVYHVQVKTEEQKKFSINNTDALIIRHAGNAVTLVDDEYAAKGTRHTPCTFYFNGKEDEPVVMDENDVLEPDYSCLEFGVYYTFKISGKPGATGYVESVVGKTTVTGDYYLYLTESTAVQPVYVHNRKILTNTISVSFKGIGVDIKLGPEFDIMTGNPMNLNAYSRHIQCKAYSVAPSGWGFDQRYYFLNEGIKKTTYKRDDFVLETERLRCGYIEEQYVNLSPNRYDAGDAYLELHSNLPIYVFVANISFWSTSEQLYSASGDYAYLQYLDKTGEWKTCFDLLAENLSTDRTKQNRFERSFLEGTYGIKFVAHKEKPNTNRNKGRISIGEMQFVSYEVNYVS